MRKHGLVRKGLWIVTALCALEARPGSPMGGTRTLADPAYQPPPVSVKPLPASLTVSIEQAATQPDPATISPVTFDVVFSAAIDPLTFTDTDIQQLGTATVTSWSIVDLGDHRHFTLLANAPSAGTIIPSLPSASVDGEAGRSNLASASADNSVTFGPIACASGIYLYAAVWSPAEIHVFCVGASGTLTARGIVNAPGDVRDLQVSPSAHSLFYAHADLTEYTISADGSLALVGSAAVGDGTFFDLALNPADPSGRLLYGTHSKNGGGVYVYDTQAPIAVPALLQSVGGLFLPRGIAVRPAGDRVHVANGGFPQEIHTYPLLGGGTLNAGAMQITSFEPRAHLFAIPPSLPLLYWTESPGGSVMSGSVGGSGGVNFVGSIFSGFGASALTLDAAAQQLYVVQNNTDDVAVYGISGSGALAFEQLADTERRPEHLVLHPAGSFLYVASAGNASGSSKITLYSVAADGHLTNLGVEATLQQGLFRLAIAEP